MNQNLFHYLGKRPLKVSTELNPRAQEPVQADVPASGAIELPPAGATETGRNVPGPEADAIDAAAAAEAAVRAEHAAQLDALQAIGATGDWPGADYNEGPGIPDQIISDGAAADEPAEGPGPASHEAPADAASAPAKGGSMNRHLSTPALPWHNNPLLMAIAAAFIAIYVAWNAGGFTDNDIWFILATGREIFENGIPYENPFAMHDGMGIVVQQWVPCLIAYGIYSLGGFVALGLWVGVLSALVVLSLYRLGRLLKGDRFGGELILLVIAVTVPALLGYLSMRPHAYTMLAFCWLLFFLEKYRRTGKVGWLVACVALVAAHVNFQMALAPFDLVIIGCYCIPDLLAPLHKRGHAQSVQLADAGYKRLPLLVCLIASAAALLASPYGLDGALYLVSSYGSASYNSYIREMRALTPWGKGLGGMAAVVMLVLAAMAAGKHGMRGINLPLTLLAFGVGFAGFAHSRNIWLIAFFALPLVMSAMHGWSLDFAKLPPRTRRKRSKQGAGSEADAGETVAAGQAPTPMTQPDEPLSLSPEDAERKLRKRRNVVWGCTAAVCLGAAIGTGVLLWQAAPEWRDYEKESDMTPSGLLDYIEKTGVDPQDVRLFNPFNIGGYLEWRGYKVFMDPRPELWAPGISGHGEDYYREYVDMMSNDDWTDRDFANFLAKYDFQYLIVENGTKISDYLKSFPTDYMSLLGTGDYTLWGKKDAATGSASSGGATGSQGSEGEVSAQAEGDTADAGAAGSSSDSDSPAADGRDPSARPSPLANGRDASAERM